MKILISLLVMFFLSAGGVAEANYNAKQTLTTGVIALPTEVRSAQGQFGFKPAYEKLVKAFEGFRNHERKNLVLMGYEVVKTQDHLTSVALHYGTTTDMWPTR
ncbi:MAG: hypothetical protein ACXVBE_11095, partial [Bdellovibrionota bacterium]